MPTCSTSKLPAKYQTGGGGLFHKRYRRPQSCKYDTYRVRSRRSQVSSIITYSTANMSQDDKDKDEDELEWDFVRLPKNFFRATKKIELDFVRLTKHCLGSHCLDNCLTGARVWRQYLVEVRLNLKITQNQYQYKSMIAISISLNNNKNIKPIKININFRKR